MIVWVIETNFGDGWEIESDYDNYEDASCDLKEYQIYAASYGGKARMRKTEVSE